MRLHIDIWIDHSYAPYVCSGVNIPRALCRHVIVVRDPADAVQVCAVDPAVEAGIVHVDGFLDAQGFGGQVFQNFVPHNCLL